MKLFAPLLVLAIGLSSCSASTEGPTSNVSFAESRSGLVSAGGVVSVDAGPAVSSDAAEPGTGLGVCGGEYRGSYAGDDEGDATATITDDGLVSVTFLSAGAGFSIEGSGLVAGASVEVTLSSGATATGAFDIAQCSIAGVWANEGLAISGTWVLERQAPASTDSGCAGEGRDFRSVVLFRADFRGRVLRCADFALAELAQPDFTDADLDNVSFRGADLEEPVFIGTSLRNADFRGALLTRATFIEVDLSGADFQITVADGATFVATTCPDGTVSESNGDTC